MKHSVHPFSEGGHRRFLLAVSLGERHVGGVRGGGGAGGRQHAGRVLGLQRHGRLRDGPDFGLGFCILKAWAGIEGGVLLVDGCEFGTLWRQSVFFGERLRDVAVRERRDFTRTTFFGKKLRPWFTVGTV